MKKAAAKEKSRKILGLLSNGEGRAFLAKGVAKMYGRQAAEKRRFGEVFSRVVDPYSFFTDPDPDPVDPDGCQYGSGYGSGSGSNPDPGL